MKKTTKSAGVLDVLENGNIYIETGASENLITRLGSSDKGKFTPYKSKIKDVTVFFPYVIHKDYIPTNFKGGEPFLQAMESQVDTNAYIQNYIRIGAETLATYLKDKGLIDPKTWVVSVGTVNNMTNHWFDFFITESGCKGIYDLFTIDMDVDPEMLSVSSTAGDSSKDLGELLGTLQRPDRVYDVDKVSFTDEDLRSIDGFLEVDSELLSKIPSGSMIVLLGDFVETGAPLNEAYRKLKAMGYKVLYAVGIAKKYF